MITWSDFEDAVCNSLGRDISKGGNAAQNFAIRAPMNQSLFLVAGPGSGKTTAISLRVLKLIFVDDIDPASIVVTTFTKKAAAELRSRILSWGDQLKQIFLKRYSDSHLRGRLENLNVNRVISGTLDSISEEILGDYRVPGEPPPVIIEDFVSNALMIRVGLFSQGRHNSDSLRDYITFLRGTSYGLNVAELARTLLEIKDRFAHDQIDVADYRANATCRGVIRVCEAIADYEEELQSGLLFDFARLEREFLNKLQSGALSEFLNGVRFVLVDEYQDTNLLQEQIYFSLAQTASRNGGSMTVVGDDDQSLYRFRGATVDLFQSYQNRFNNRIGVNATVVYLSQNYRSTRAIVDFCNAFASMDRQFQTVRVGKPQITASRSQPFANYPVLGMFRDDVDSLATDLAHFIHSVVHGPGFNVRGQHGECHTIRINPQGSPSDIALLFSSPREFDSQGNPRLPLRLDNALSQFNPPIRVFNPRGQSLPEVLCVRQLCGLILECVDPDSVVQGSIPNLPSFARDTFDGWRNAARDFINANPNPNVRRSLRQFVDAWQSRTPLGTGKWSRREVPFIDLVYKLVTWLPIMQDDIEGVVYLEALTRTITQSSLFSDFKGELVHDPSNPSREHASIKEIFWNNFVPFASEAIEVNEELLETLPTDRINIMSIHQAKGLEFPLVIVDVGSDFRREHPAQAFKRFPADGGQPCKVEDELRRYSPLGQSPRRGQDRAFDDLIRHYFVAYSRAQDVLLLVGLNSVRQSIRNVATGWDRDGNWHWGYDLPNLLHI